MLVDVCAAACVLAAVVGAVVTRPRWRARRSRLTAAEQRDFDETVAYLAALRPKRFGVPRRLQRIQRARQLGRSDLRAVSQRDQSADGIQSAAA